MSSPKSDEAPKQRVLSQFKQRPWLLIPVLGVVPLFWVLLIVHARQSPSSQAPLPAAEATTAAIAVPGALQTTPPAQQPTNTPKPKLGPELPAAFKSKATASTKKPGTSAQTSSKQSSKTAKASAASPQRQAANSRSAKRAYETAMPIDPVVEMRVAVANGVNSLAIATSTTGAVLDPNGRLLHKMPASEGYSAQSDGQGISLGPWQVPAAVWIEPSAGGYVYVGDRWYRGRLLLTVQENGLLAVNYVTLQDYLYSVVGAEVSPSWPMAALKAQAVAARSYALTYYFKPASSLYHIGNTEAYQVYAGVEKEANTTHEAVNSTGGEFLSYKGGIVESLYAASDDIVATAHGGVGMSQLGALKLAEQGYDYRHILGTYYPGTGLSRIEVDHE